jgi:hypothetical protein
MRHFYRCPETTIMFDQIAGFDGISVEFHRYILVRTAAVRSKGLSVFTKICQ